MHKNQQTKCGARQWAVACGGIFLFLLICGLVWNLQQIRGSSYVRLPTSWHLPNSSEEILLTTNFEKTVTEEAPPPPPPQPTKKARTIIARPPPPTSKSTTSEPTTPKTVGPRLLPNGKLLRYSFNMTPGISEPSDQCKKCFALKDSDIQTKYNICSNGKEGYSSIDCSRIGNIETVCTLKNVMFKTSALGCSRFGGESLNENEANAVEKQRTTEDERPHFGQEFPWFTADCQIDKSQITGEHFMHLQDEYSGIQSLNKKEITDCKWEERHALFINRMDHHNLYHQFQAWVNTWQTIQVLGIPANESIVIVWVDGYAHGHLDGIWGQIFAAEIKQLKDYKNENICYRKATPVIRETNSIIQFAADFYGCHGHSSFEHFRRLFLYTYDLKWTTSDRPRLTLIVRHPYRRNPHLRLVERVWRNEKQLIERLTRPDRWDLEVVVLEDKSFRDQLELITRTDILIGAHGAGITHMAFLPEKSICIEIYQSGTHINFYNHLTTWMRHVELVSVWGGPMNWGTGEFDAPIDEVSGKVEHALNSIRSSRSWKI